MKKIFTMILVATGLSFAASAQNNNIRYSSHGRYQSDQQSKDYGYNSRDGRNNDYRRQAEYDRMNRQYDDRVNGYRNDRSLNSRERNRRIQQAEQERQQKAKAFGTGLVIGGIGMIVLGAIFSHGQ